MNSTRRFSRAHIRARANHERTCMERDALGLREWAVDMLGADSLDPREEPGWDDAFVEASVIEAREVANHVYGRSRTTTTIDNVRVPFSI